MEINREKNNKYALMDYLSGKLFKTCEDISFQLQRNKYNNNGYTKININYLIEIKTQLNQASLAIKALVSENKLLSQEIINFQKKMNKEIYLNQNNKNKLRNNENNNDNEIYFKIKELNMKENINIVKPNRIFNEYSSEILMKISNNPNCVNILKKKYGNNFMRKIISKEVDYDYLNGINKIIDDYIQKQNNLNENQFNKNNEMNLNESLNLPLRIKMVNQDYFENVNKYNNVNNSSINQIKKSKSYSNISSIKQKNIYKENKNNNRIKINSPSYVKQFF